MTHDTRLPLLALVLSAGAALASAEAAPRPPMTPDTILCGAAYYHE